MKKSELTFIAIYKFIESCKYYRAQALEHPHHFPCAQKDESFITPGANHWRHCLRLPGGHWSSTDLESKVHESPIFFGYTVVYSITWHCWCFGPCLGGPWSPHTASGFEAQVNDGETRNLQHKCLGLSNNGRKMAISLRNMTIWYMYIYIVTISESSPNQGRNSRSSNRINQRIPNWPLP
jgi:hypothetical protein